MNAPSRPITTLAILAVLLFSNVTMGLDLGSTSDDVPLLATGSGGLGSPLAGTPDAIRPGDLDGLGEGGGPLQLFADDMAPLTADHYAAMGLPDYYGGALPAPGEGVERWRHEWYRWGTEAVRGDGAWTHEAEGISALRFGEGSTESEYPAGAVAELVSPVIDLREVVNLEAAAGMVVTSSRSTSVVVPNVLGVDDAINNARDAGEEVLVSQGVLDEDRRLDARTHIQEATAALRLRHAYGFDQMLRDGGRVEAAYLDPYLGWSDWTALEPEAGALRIGERQAHGRTATEDGTTVGLVLKPGDPNAEVSVSDALIASMTGSEESVVTVSDGPDGPVVDLTGREAQDRHMYQGVIEASRSDVGRGPWKGFGGESGGLVESVFNLTAFAGHMVRLRFVTASAESAIPGADTHPGLGWLLDDLEVHGLGAPGMQILGLATPGDGAFVAPDRDFQPTVAVHNTFQEPLSTRLQLAVDGSVATSSAAETGVGPRARVLLAPDLSFHDLVGSPPTSGRYAIEAWVDAQQEIPTDGVQGTMVEPFSTQSQKRFHVLVGTGSVGTGSGWEVTGVEFEPEGDSRRPFFIERGQQGRVHVSLRNLAAVPQELDLTEDAAALRPRLLDATLQPVGTFEPDQDKVMLDVTRDTSGTLGIPGAETTISYRWSGTLDAGVLRPVVENAEGDILAEGSRVLVDAALPPMVSEVFGNLWLFDGPDCGRVAEFEGLRGVLRCGVTAEAPPPGEEGGDDPDEGLGLPVGFSASQAVIDDDGNLDLGHSKAVLYLRPFEGPVEDVRAACEEGAQNETVAGLAGDLSDACEDIPRLAEQRPTVADALEVNLLHPDLSAHEDPAVLKLITGSRPRFESAPLQPDSRIGDGDPKTGDDKGRDSAHVVLYVQLGLLPDRDAEPSNTTMKDLDQTIVPPSVTVAFLGAAASNPDMTTVFLNRTTAVQKVEFDVPFPSSGFTTNEHGDITFDDGQALFLEFNSNPNSEGPITVYMDHPDYPSRIEVPVPAGDLATLSGFKATPDAGHAPLTVAFQGELEVGDRELESVVFDPGDGSLPRELIDEGLVDNATGGSIHLEHTYFRAGSFQPRLDIQEKAGVFLTHPLSVEVERSHGVAVSPVLRAELADLQEAQEGKDAPADTQLDLIHRGGGGVLRLRALPEGASTEPPARDRNDWAILHELEYPASDEWVRTTFTLPIAAKSQWIVFDLEAPDDEWSVAEIRWKAGDVILGGSDFRVELRPDDGDLAASGSTGLANLDVEVPGLDAILELPRPIPLHGVRPTLEFRHWLDTGDRGIALVEVAPADLIPLDGAGHGAGPPSLPPGTDPVWQVATAFHGTFTDNALRPVRIDLSPYLGWDAVQVRLRYQEPVANQGERDEFEAPLVTTGVKLGRGWFVEEVAVRDLQASGAETLHQAGSGFDGYRRAHVAVAQEFSGVPLGARLAEERLTIDYLPDQSWQCAGPQRPNAYRVGPVAVTDPIDLRSTFDPVLSMEHEFLHLRRSDNVQSDTNSISDVENRRTRYVIDLEFQAMRADGSWPGQWIRATPNDPRFFNVSSALDVDPRTGQPGINGPGGSPPAIPFLDHDLPWYLSLPENVPPGQIRALQADFDIGEDNRIAGNIVRFRAHLWQEYDADWSDNLQRHDCGHPFSKPEWNIISFDIRERRHFSDVAVQPLSFDVQDTNRIDQLEPTAGAVLGLNGASLLSNDEAAILRVPVSNEGIIDQDVKVSLTRERFNGPDLEDAVDVLPFRFLIPGDDGNLRLGGPDEPGIIRGLAPGEVREAIFRIDASGAPPGRYRFTVDVEPLTARDTNPDNDRADISAEITPFRAITLDASQSAVTPFVATGEAQRRVQVTVRNEGNIDEGAVQLSARLVELRGVPGLSGSFEEVEGSPALTESEIFVGRRTGEHEFLRVIDTEGLGLEAGKRYAVLVEYDVGGDSVVPWWEGEDVPDQFEGVQPEEIGDGGLQEDQILDISRDLGLCDCMLLPFRVEESLFSQSHSASDHSLFPEAFPAAALWTHETRWNGEPVDPDDPLNLPQWQQVEAGEVEGIGGLLASGQVWRLPAYEGVDDLEHILESPVLPAHVVKATSRAFLDMRYASDLVDGQAVVEVRDMERTGDGEWRPARGVGGEWRPVDEVRTQRVAVIIPPDYPQVVANNISSPYSIPASGMQVPPFYEKSAEDEWSAKPCKRDETSRGRFCHWSPFPDFPATGNPAWHAALNDTLRGLAAELGHQNVGLFTTVTDDLQIGHEETETGAVYEVPRVGAEPLRFPVRTLDDLYLNLTDYGAIALLGDGISHTFADQSRSLVRMSHGDGAADQERDPVYEGHALRVFAILREAGDAGVSVIAAIGPAPATVAASRAAPPGTAMTVWQQPQIPADLDTGQRSQQVSSGQARLRCSAIHVDGRAHGEEKHRTQMTTFEKDRQTKVFCNHQRNAGGELVTSIDRDQLRNYYFYASEDAQSLALRDLLDRNGIDFRHSSPFGDSALCPKSPTTGHGATIDPGDAPANPCIIPDPLIASGHGGSTFITAPYARDTGDWVEAIVGNLTATGGLPAGSGSWQRLPARLAAPFGGALDRDEAGNELFRGEPVQFRIRVQSDPVLGGHGALTIDRIELLGTPNTHDVGVRFVEPRHEVHYSPGQSFSTLLSVVNRGTETADDVKVKFTVNQVGHCDGEGTPPGQCKPTLPNCPVSQGLTRTLDVGTLLPGEVRVIRNTDLCPVGDDRGRFPDKGSHPPDAAPPSRWAFEASLDADFGDLDPTNNVHRVVALGRKIIDAPVTTVRLEPNAAPVAGTVETVRAHIEVRNRGTQTDQVFVELTLHPVRLDGCQNEIRDPILACYPPGHPSAGEQPDPHLLRAETHLTATRDGRATGSVDLPVGAAGIPPGTYRVQVTAFVGGVVQATPGPQWLHLVDPSVAPDQARPFDAADLSPLAGGDAGLPAQTQGNPVFVAGGFSTDAGGGACQPDGTTVADGESLVHGWWVTDQESHPCGATRNHLAIQWMRDARPTFDHSNPPSYGPAGNQNSATQQGDGDFGPDILYWYPHDERTDGVRSNEPVFTLATLQEPVLRLDARYQLTPKTIIGVDAQPALRDCPPPTQERKCSWHWPDADAWFTLSSAETRDAPPVTRDATGNHTPNVGPTRFHRQTNTNPLAGTHGFWGGNTFSADGDGWQVIEYDLSDFQAWCDGLVTPGGQFSTGQFSRITEGCRFTDSNGYLSGGGDIPVPIRFRIVAASYGGDEGVNFFEVRDLAVTSHHVGFAGADVRSPIILDQPDASTAPRLPLRIENTGPIHETLRVSIQDAPGTTLFPGIDVKIGPTSAGPFEDGLVVEVPAHSATVVWVQAFVPIELAEVFPPGRDHPMPFIVRAESVLGDPTLRPEVFFDAKMRTRSWADLETDCFFIREDDRCTSVFPAEREVPVAVTVPVTNRGRLDVDPPILVRLYEEEISLDPATGDPTVLQRRVARDAAGAPSEAIIDAVITSGKKQTELVDLEWNPPDLGLYRLVAEVNLPHQGDDLDPISETRLDNNVRSRFVAVGRVSLSDLHIEEARLVEFGTGRTVERAVEGHNYRVVASVRNHGNAPALAPTMEFRVGSSSPFSFWNAPTFPGDGATMEVQSSVWTAVGRQDGTPQRFLIGITTQSPSASVDGKDLEFIMPVDRYGWRAEDPGQDILLLPGTRTVLSFNVTNTGTAAGTPVVTSSHDDLQTDLLAMAPVDPGETARVDVAVSTPPGFETDGSALALTLTAKEDPRRPLRLPGEIVVLDLGTPTGHAFPVQALPGPVDATLAFDNPANIATTWALDNASAPVSVREGAPVPVAAFDRVMENVTLIIDPHTAPGRHDATLRFLVGPQTNAAAQMPVDINVTLHVLPRPLLEATVGDPDPVRHGEPARVSIDLFNAGNVPVEARLQHTVDRGQLQVEDDGPFRIAPGHIRTVHVDVIEGKSTRVLGRTMVDWNGTDDPAQTIDLPWQAAFLGNNVRIVETDLDTLKVTAGAIHRVRATVENPADQAVQAEVLVVVDGLLHDRTVLDLGPGASAQAVLPFQAGPADRAQTVTVLVRPADSTVGLADAAFYEVGDAVLRETTPTADDGKLPISATGAPALLVLVFAAVLLARRRWS